MDGFLAWLAFGWAVFWDQIGGWFGIAVFIGSTGLLSVVFAYLFKWLRQRHSCSHIARLGEKYTALVDMIHYDPVREYGSSTLWHKASRKERLHPWRLDVQTQAKWIVAMCWPYEESEKDESF